MTYRKDTQTVLYHSKMNPNLKRNFALFPVLDWIAEIATHIPNKGEQLVLTMAPTETSSGERERRKKSKKNRLRSRRSPPPPVSRELKRRWSHFIRKVYETDPLVFPRVQVSAPGRCFFCSGEPPTDKNRATTQFISSLIASWRSYTEQSQTQSGSEP